MAWFCYELDHSGRPVPCIYYDEPPTSSGKRTRLQIILLIPEIDGEFSLTKLSKLYPYKENNLDNTTQPVVKSEQQLELPLMTHPVQGFLTSQGKFFETEPEADFYEASYKLNQVTTEAVEAIGVSGEGQIEAAVAQIISFINTNAEAIEAYLFTKRVLGAGSVGDEVDRQPAEDNQTDDQSLRPTSDSVVDEQTDAEAELKAAGVSS